MSNIQSIALASLSSGYQERTPSCTAVRIAGHLPQAQVLLANWMHLTAVGRSMRGDGAIRTGRRDGFADLRYRRRAGLCSARMSITSSKRRPEVADGLEREDQVHQPDCRSCCLGGTFEVWLEGAGCCLTCHSAHVRMAGCGLTSPCACGRWLPVWLPEILLVTLTFGCPGHDAGAGSSPYNMPRLADRVQPRAHAAAGRSGRAPCIGRPVRIMPRSAASG